jgi:hypothetical protein
MTPADQAQAAQRLLDDPLVQRLFDQIESSAIELMLTAATDDDRRHRRDTVLTVREVRGVLRNMITAHQEASRTRPGIA